MDFHKVGCSCTTCIHISGGLDESVSTTIFENDIASAVVLFENRNFEGRVHPLMSKLSHIFSSYCLVYSCWNLHILLDGYRFSTLTCANPITANAKHIESSV